MPQNDKTVIIPVALEDEVKESYLTYAMSVIVARALPDVRDGLKPVHRRILYCMNEMGLANNRPYKKCARIVGDVLGKYHPHGDQAVYDALVRMAQEFSLRMPVVQGQGNFGSIDGDPPAAMRYTEARLSRISEALLRDIKKETVNFVPNYDDSMQEPSVLPTAFPFLLVNGSNGIAVGMATNMPPHNLKEICAATVALIENPEIPIDELVRNYVPAPDFPTGATICGSAGYHQAALTGRGRVTLRGEYHVENEGSEKEKEKIIITSIPYQVNKANMVIKIADLVKEKRIEGISDLRDESNRKGIRVVVELKRGVSSRVIINLLYNYSDLQKNFSINNLALVDGRPRTCTLKELLQHFIAHRREVITRRSEFDLAKARERAHILEALKKALENIDDVIKIIKESSNVNLAKANLIERFQFTEIQAQAILDMRLQKLTSLETQKILDELAEIQKQIEYLTALLGDVSKIMEVIKEETQEISERYGTGRASTISHEEVGNVEYEDLIEEEMMVVVVSSQGFVKRVALDLYREQKRGGKGAKGTTLRDEDFVEHLFVGTTHDIVMFVTNKGKAYWVKVYELPEGSRASKGRHIKTLFDFEDSEEATATLPIKEFSETSYLFMVTRLGIVKRVATHAFRNAKRRGIIALNVDKQDVLIRAILTKGDSDIMLISSAGKGLRFREESIRVMGRNAYGVRGLRMPEGEKIVGAAVVTESETLLLVSEKGSGKRTLFDEFAPHGRGTQGQRAFKVTDKSGPLISAIAVNEEDSILCVTQLGKTIKTPVLNISQQGRNATGVKILTIAESDAIIGLGRIQNEDEFENTEESQETPHTDQGSGDQSSEVPRLEPLEESSEGELF